MFFNNTTRSTSADRPLRLFSDLSDNLSVLKTYRPQGFLEQCGDTGRKLVQFSNEKLEALNEWRVDVVSSAEELSAKTTQSIGVIEDKVQSSGVWIGQDGVIINPLRVLGLFEADFHLDFEDPIDYSESYVATRIQSGVPAFYLQSESVYSDLGLSTVAGTVSGVVFGLNISNAGLFGQILSHAREELNSVPVPLEYDGQRVFAPFSQLFRSIMTLSDTDYDTLCNKWRNFDGSLHSWIEATTPRSDLFILTEPASYAAAYATYFYDASDEASAEIENYVEDLVQPYSETLGLGQVIQAAATNQQVDWASAQAFADSVGLDSTSFIGSIIFRAWCVTADYNSYSSRFGFIMTLIKLALGSIGGDGFDLNLSSGVSNNFNPWMSLWANMQAIDVGQILDGSIHFISSLLAFVQPVVAGVVDAVGSALSWIYSTFFKGENVIDTDQRIQLNDPDSPFIAPTDNSSVYKPYRLVTTTKKTFMVTSDVITILRDPNYLYAKYPVYPGVLPETDYGELLTQIRTSLTADGIWSRGRNALIASILTDFRDRMSRFIPVTTKEDLSSLGLTDAEFLERSYFISTLMSLSSYWDKALASLATDEAIYTQVVNTNASNPGVWTANYVSLGVQINKKVNPVASDDALSWTVYFQSSLETARDIFATPNVARLCAPTVLQGQGNFQFFLSTIQVDPDKGIYSDSADPVSKTFTLLLSGLTVVPSADRYAITLLTEQQISTAFRNRFLVILGAVAAVGVATFALTRKVTYRKRKLKAQAKLAQQDAKVRSLASSGDTKALSKALKKQNKLSKRYNRFLSNTALSAKDLLPLSSAEEQDGAVSPTLGDVLRTITPTLPS